MKQSDYRGKQIGKGFDVEPIQFQREQQQVVWRDETMRYDDAHEYMLLHDTVIQFEIMSNFMFCDWHLPFSDSDSSVSDIGAGRHRFWEVQAKRREWERI